MGTSVAVGTLGMPSVAAAAGTPVASPTTGGWSVTDDRDQVIELPAVPVNIIAQTISGASLWDFGIKVRGIYGDEFLAEGDPQMGDMNPDDVEVVGTWASGLDLEHVFALDAELFVDISRSEDGAIWSLTPEVEEALREICPTFAISVYQQPMPETINRFEQVAAGLGADLTAPAIVDAKAAFATSDAAFREAVAAKPELKVLILTGDPTTNAFFVSPLNGGGVGLYAAQSGLNIVEPENLDPAQLDVFETASWEQVGKYPADLILYDARADPAVFADDPLWSSLPAVQAGQVGKWYSTAPYSWQRINPIVDDMTRMVSEAEIVT